MLKKTITFENLDGEQVTRDYYFNINKAELLSLQLSEKGGLDKKLEKIQQEDDYNGLFEFIKTLILLSYGEKDDDGIKFIKARNGIKLATEFEQSEAFSELIMELISSADALNAFVNGIIPKDVAATANKLQAK
jgi:hypothetical protein